ncbi:Reversal of tor2 lethality [Ascosphaera acerosa]|nr:Reversal of tor2 lethality [Ascosphaera acerosa]
MPLSSAAEEAGEADTDTAAVAGEELRAKQKQQQQAADADSTQTHALDGALVGTWASKSGRVRTGAGFYDHEADEFIEPALPGISYAFGQDGWFEEALYRVVANPIRPDCPKAVLQWQHGRWSVLPNGSLVLEPVKVDGRQQVADPCFDATRSYYSRYNLSETFRSYEVVMDRYHAKPRLNLISYDGTPVNPLWWVSGEAAMLPTTTLDTSRAGATGSASGGMERRGEFTGETTGEEDGKGTDRARTILTPRWRWKGNLLERIDSDRVWWAGLAMSVMGVAMLLRAAAM